MAKPQRNRLGSGGDPNTIYVAKQSGSSVDPKTGETMVYVRGVTRVRGGHVLLRLNPDAFEPVEEHLHYDVEQATKSPGEQRGARAAIAKATSRTKPAKSAPAPEPEPTTAPAEPEPEGSRGIRLSDLSGGS